MDYKEMNGGSNIHHNECMCKTSNREKECKGTVEESSTLGKCENTCMQKYPYYKLPVVIAEFTVQIDTESKIKLCEPAIEIKRIKKNVFLTQCRLIGKTGKVFISGFVRKNIEYATMDCCNNSAICGDIKHTTVHIPFQCVTELKNMKCPKYQYNPPTEEMIYWDEKNMGSCIKEVDFHSEEYFNEKVYCELVNASIYEADIVKDSEKLNCLPVEHVFQSFIEKEVLCLTIRLLQNQQVCCDNYPKYPYFEGED